ncbi:MAG: tetratricopeptide repeat protein [Tepidisphaeraceae bacterium]
MEILPNASVRRPALIAALGLVFITFLTYAPVYRAGFIWDDDEYVTENPALLGADGLRWIWLEPGATPQYYPLTFTTFWLERRIWGDRPLGYHVVNVALHAANTVLAWRVLSRLGVPGAWVAAAVFAVHPVHVESIAWVSERKNVLSGFFYLAAALAYLRRADRSSDDAARESEAPAAPRRSRQPRLGQSLAFPATLTLPTRGRYLAALALFVCALLGKTVTSSLPAAILLVTWWKRGRARWRDVRALIPFFVIGAIAGLYTSHMERTHVGAAGPEWDYSAVERVLIAGRAVWFYLGKLLVPSDLSFMYPQWTVRPATAWQWVFPLAAAAAVVALWSLRRRIGRGPLVAALFFGGTLAPALGFVDVFPMRYTFVADHYQYLASLGMIVLGVVSASALPRRSAPFRPVVALGVIGALCVLTFDRARAFESLETIWRDTESKNPDSPIVLNNYGMVLLGQGRLDEAETKFRRVRELKPTAFEPHSNLAAVAEARGDNAAAIEHLRAALAVDPRAMPPHLSLGRHLAEAGRVDQAVLHYSAWVRFRPNDVAARQALATTLYRQARQRVADGNPDGAVESLNRLLRIDPRRAAAHNDLGRLLEAKSQIDDAAAHYRRALELDPSLDAARHNLDRVTSGR